LVAVRRSDRHDRRRSRGPRPPSRTARESPGAAWQFDVLHLLIASARPLDLVRRSPPRAHDIQSRAVAIPVFSRVHELSPAARAFLRKLAAPAPGGGRLPWFVTADVPIL